jgi:flagellar assembly protein FliH
MSTSLSRSPLSPSAQTVRESPLKVSDFLYSEIAVVASEGNFGQDGLSPAASNVDDTEVRETQAREQGRQEGEATASKNFSEQLARERASLVAALTQFAREREAYYQTVEGQVVQLALSIARKILHREAQVDPLLLAGIVKVALDKIEGATDIVLLVHPENVADWRRFLASQLAVGKVPHIVEDPAIERDRCTLKTSMGTAQLGIEVQLKEIEHGLMDLLAARPPQNP